MLWMKKLKGTSTISSVIVPFWKYTIFSVFEKIAAHCDKKLDYIPLTFMLGFFVTVIIDRWRNIFNNMGWIEKYAFYYNT